MEENNFISIEKKWQKKWLGNPELETDYLNTENKKYCLTMFSYPSGDKLHIGHWYNYGPVDTFCRFLKMNGYNIFQPQGFDAFGLPAENYAIKHGVHPAVSTDKNISTMRKQLKAIGALYNWDKEVVTCEKEYYKWTQWLFLKLYENNLAYRTEALVNWDPVDQTVLANEQVLSDGTSERSGAEVIQKPLKQWFLKITDYAEELLDFNEVNWPNKTKMMQKNWIGKSQGATVKFCLQNSDFKINVFTTRPDTLFGATYLVVSPEHSMLDQFNLKDDNDILEYCEKAKKKSELQRTDLSKEKTGVFTGLYAINPVNNERIPVWIADYVLVGYGTGAIMAVPGHDQRDFEFAKTYEIKIVKVVDLDNVSIDDNAFTENGIAVNSDFLNGMNTDKAKIEMIAYLEKNNFGEKTTTYRLKDWLISRQRYWGTPIPIVYDPNGKAHPIPEEYLPWLLPEDVEYKPKGTSPLGSSSELVERTEKIFGKGWRPEIDTMDTFMCSSWYFLRYPDSQNSNQPFSKESLKWLPVDYYIGGAEHATMHLLYARFITKVLRDLKFLEFNEPFLNLYHQGTITKNSVKMSKSKGNTVAPDDFVDSYGSDTFRCYLMFMGPFDEGGDWNDKGIKGIYRFLNKSFAILEKGFADDETSEDLFIYNDTIKKVTEDLKLMKFNTALSKMMEFVNFYSNKKMSKNIFENFVKILSPFAPHISEELWSRLENKNSVFSNTWPKFDESKLVKDKITVAVQVNGKLRGQIDVSSDLSKDDILLSSKEHENVQNHINDKEIIKEIYVPGKLVNFVVK